MHPISFLFEDIYRNHWGIPQEDRRRVAKRLFDFPLSQRSLVLSRNGKRR